MKKLMTLILLALVLVGCNQTDTETELDSVKFKKEYEALNGTMNDAGVEYLTVEIPEANRLVYATEEEIIEIFEGGSGVIFFGFPECPWCRSAINVMNEAAKEASLGRIHYVNVLEMRDAKSLNSNGEIVVDEAGSDFYYKLLEYLGDSAPVYPGLDSEDERRILVPLVVSVTYGEIADVHMGTLDSHTDPYVPLTDAQVEELKNIYKDGFSAVSACTIEVAC